MFQCLLPRDGVTLDFVMTKDRLSATENELTASVEFTCVYLLTFYLVLLIDIEAPIPSLHTKTKVVFFL